MIPPCAAELCEATIGLKRMRKERKNMKYHKFFAWAAAICFMLAIITGYKRK